MNGDQQPDTTTGNPFQLIAYLLFKVRHSLEDIDEPGRPPRWVRIARARQAQGESDYIGRGVKAGIDGFSTALSYMIELTLDIREILVQTDAGKALVEVSADLIKAATDDNFVNGVRALVGQAPGSNPLSGVGATIDDIKKYIDYIPDPEDVAGMGHELYRLMCIEQLPFPRNPAGDINTGEISAATSEHLNVDSTGKVRLMQWAFSSDTPVYGLGSKEQPESEEHAIFRLGSRRTWQTATDQLPGTTVVTREISGATETMVEFFFDSREDDADKRTVDLVEVHTLLEKLGYGEPALSGDAERKSFSDKLTQRLRRFQIVNDLPKSGELDNATLNRMLHLDFDGKNLIRAKPFDTVRLPPSEVVDDPKIISRPLRLVNPAADTPEEENIAIKRDRPRYAYYLAGHTASGLGPIAEVAATGGWISDNSEELTPGFVALQSRLVAGGSDEGWYDGGRWSEGEAASGFLFFAARHVEPWRGGRQGTPGDGALFGGQRPTQGAISRMYQWVDLAPLMSQLTTGYELYLKATCMRRSLYRDRANNTGLPDDGRIVLEIYGSEGFGGNLGTQRDASKGRLAEDSSAWWPDQVATAGELTIDAIMRKRNWKPQTTQFLKVPAGATGALIALEGRHQSAYDIDAYFDNVQLTYEFRKTA
ncbi:MAG: peptidoglycan-binding protein [Proteobacteria bacterium]|nr:peptidoglycan-binding protein [Pseudomonadota bacterium]